MTTHLSTRILWHDRGWDGHVCHNAVENSSCLLQQHVRESRDDELEMEFADTALQELDGWLPPCARDPNAFSRTSFWITHRDPLEWRNLPSVQEEIPPFSICPAPYRWMREEHLRDIVGDYEVELPPPDDSSRESGWVNEPKRQRILLKRFWDELECGQSLVFLYCNRGNPIEDGPSRLLVGVSRLGGFGTQLMFGKTPQYGADHPVWTRRVTLSYPEEGFRLPLQEYLRAGHPVDDLVCTVPEGGIVPFSYVAEHVSDDLAVGALEQLLHSVDCVRRDGLVAGDWDSALAWLDEALGQTWSGRGLLPGIGSMLRALGMHRGIAFQRAEFSQPGLTRSDLWQKAEALLRGAQQPEDMDLFYESLKAARQTWRQLPEPRRQLLALLARFELSVDQVMRLSEPRKRRESGVEASEDEILENPYILFEMDHGSADSARVALGTVDRGLVLDPVRSSGEDVVPRGAISRVRACAVAVLEKAAADTGDTFLPLEELLDRIEDEFPERRRCDTDLDVFLANEEFLGEALHIEREHDPPLVALAALREAETRVRELVERRWSRELDVVNEPDWSDLIATQFREQGATALAPELEERAQSEKVDALRLLYRRRLSVLTGRAGTGKTSVIRALLDGIEAVNGRQAVLLLAPTGKARVRLYAATGRPAQTIHQFLLRNGWLDEDTLRIRHSGGTRKGAPTVIVDEASMVPVDLLGALCAALDTNDIQRLIFVGDPNQLPPIGPGRPFVDLIAWLEDEDALGRRACLAKLTERARHEDADSRALQLADRYLRDTPPPGSDELLAEVARGESGGDLAVQFYEGPAELRSKLFDVVQHVVDPSPGEADYQAFTRSLGAEGPTGERAEAWQVLSPVRAGSSGTDDLNRQIQQRFKAGLLNPRRRRKTSFGDEDIVWTDKVIQIQNRGRKAWPRSTGADYVANGEIGVVVETQREGKYLDVAYSTQRDVTYRYWGDDADNELRLAYAVTVHKAQGSDFETVILLLPTNASTLSRELLYTALTRFRKRMILLVEKDVAALLEFSRPERSQVALRNTNLFEPMLRPEETGRPFAHRLIHRASDPEHTLVRSKEELVVIEKLLELGVSVKYEQRLDSRLRENDFRLPDFTITYEGDTYYWEHLGMLDVPSYARKWRRKRQWYEDSGYVDRLITSAVDPGGGLDAGAIKERGRRRILLEEPRGADEPGFD